MTTAQPINSDGVAAKGGVYLVTGGSSGIGLHCATTLATYPGARVIVASRTSPPKPANPAITHIPLDLTSADSVRSFVANWKFGKISSLILNAGIANGSTPRFAASAVPKTPAVTSVTNKKELGYDSDQVEIDFAVNHLHQALLFFLLANNGSLTDDCRVIFNTTALHDPKQPMNRTPPHWEGPGPTARAVPAALQDPGIRYSTTKLANLFFTYALSRHITNTGASNNASTKLTVMSFEPGFCPGNGSNLGREAPWLLRTIALPLVSHNAWIFRRRGVEVSTPARSGGILAEIASGKRFPGAEAHGKYILLEKIKDSSEASLVQKDWDDIWSWTIDRLAMTEEERASFAAVA